MAETCVLIAAASGRALAASAARGGYAPLVADCFGDLDTLAVACAHRRLPSGIAGGMQAAELAPALQQLAAGRQPCGLVWGTGFEDRPELLAELGARWPLLGNDADTVRQIKDPLWFARLCDALGVAHPETAPTAPRQPAGWLRKRRGGAGGAHIRRACDGADSGTDGCYFQREIAGVAVSVLFLAAGGQARVLGCSEQWRAPTPLRPFRYGGAVRPAAPSPAVADALADTVRRLAAAVPLAGLNSADFLVEGGDCWLLEVNPRPGATLDIFEPADGSLVALHIAACGGRLPPCAPMLSGAAASAIAYAEHDLPALACIDWPAWVHDRPQPGTAIRAGEPVCTVQARAPSAAEARRLVQQRLAAVRGLYAASAA